MLLDAAILGVQLLCAIATVHLVRRRCSLLQHAPQSAESAVRGFSDLGLPLIVALPVAAAMLRSEAPLGHIELATVSAPVGVGALGVGACFLFIPTRIGGVRAIGGAHVAVVCATGAVLLLLAMLDRLILGVGQTVFAAAVILVWRNVPEDRERRPSLSGQRAKAHLFTCHAETEASAPTGFDDRGTGFLLLLTTLAHTAALGWQFGPVRPIALSLAILTACILILIAQASFRAFGPPVALRTAMWTASFGVLFSIGFLSLSRVTGAMIAMGESDTSEGLVTIAHSVASGFAPLGSEAVILAGLPLLTVAARIADPRWQRIFSAALMACAVALLAWRLLPIGT